MQQTEKLSLNLIEGSDDVSPVPLNENMEKVEAQFDAVGGLITGLTASLGSGGHNARVAWGMYQGAGTYGADGPNTLTFDFTPALLVVVRDSYGSTPSTLPRGIEKALVGSAQNIITWGTHSVSWYCENTQVMGDKQLNDYGAVYRYAAVGY